MDADHTLLAQVRRRLERRAVLQLGKLRVDGYPTDPVKCQQMVALIDAELQAIQAEIRQAYEA